MEDKLEVLDRHYDDRFSPDLTGIYDLTLQLSRQTVSFSVFDTEKNRFIGVEAFRGPLTGVLEQNSWLKRPFHSVFVILAIGRSTLIPSLLYESGHQKELLEFSSGIEQGEVVQSDYLSHLEIRTLYSIDKELYDQLGSLFPTARICHLTSALIGAIGLYFIDRSGGRRIYIHARDEAADILVFDGKQLVYSNSFQVKAPEDLVYYVMFVMEQLQMNPEETGAVLMGSMDKKSPSVDLLSRYIRKIDFAKHSENFSYSYALEEIPGHYYFTLLNPGS